MRVVHIIPSVNRKDGGPTTALLGLASTQVMAGMAVEVLTTFRADDSNAMVQVFESRGVRMRTVGPVRGKLGQHPDLDAAVEESVARADVVHIHAVWEEILHKAAQAAQRQQVPYIVRPCGMLDPWSLKRWRIFKKGLLTWRIRKNLNQAMALHCTSDTELAGIRQLGRTASIWRSLKRFRSVVCLHRSIRSSLAGPSCSFSVESIPKRGLMY